MIKTSIFNPTNKPTLEEKTEIVEFLYKHLEKYGDAKEDITKCLNFAVKDSNSFGGFVLVARDGDKMVGVVVIEFCRATISKEVMEVDVRYIVDTTVTTVDKSSYDVP